MIFSFPSTALHPHPSHINIGSICGQLLCYLMQDCAKVCETKWWITDLESPAYDKNLCYVFGQNIFDRNTALTFSKNGRCSDLTAMHLAVKGKHQGQLFHIYHHHQTPDHDTSAYLTLWHFLTVLLSQSPIRFAWIYPKIVTSLAAKKKKKIETKEVRGNIKSSIECKIQGAVRKD